MTVAAWATRTGPPRRTPWPADCVLDGKQLMLGGEQAPDSNKPDGAGARVMSAKPEDQQKVVPSEYGYSAQNPIIDQVHAWTDMSLGYGVRIQAGQNDRQYKYALGADMSVSHQWIKGPDVTTFTPATVDATNGANRSFELGGVLYVLNGRYCQQRVSDASFTVAKDFGAGQVAADAAVFYSAGAGGGQYAYVAMGDSCAVWRAGPTWAIQNVAISGTPTGGTFLLTYGGTASAPIAYNATAGTVQSSLSVIPGLSGVSVTLIAGVGSANATFAVEFKGVASPATLGTQDNMTGGTHAIAVTTATAYAAVAWTQRVMEQRLTITSTPTLGTYTLKYGTTATGNLAYNASAGTIQTALRLISGLSAVTVTAFGDSPNFTHTIRFEGVNDYTQVLVVDASGVTGGTFTMSTYRSVLKARAWAVTGRSFYRGHATNNLAVVDVDADPFVEENWSAPNNYVVGDVSFGIQRMAVTVSGTLVVFKTDGPYVLDQGGQDWMLVPHMHGAQDTQGGEPQGYFTNDIYVTYGTGCYKLNPQMQMEEIGPERLTSNNSPVAGRMTAFAGDRFNLYGAIWNQDTSRAYLLKFGAYLSMATYYGLADPHESSRRPHLPSREDVWNGSITQAYTARITLLAVSTIGADADHQRLYIGFADGSLGWFQLPCRPNPAACSNYRFTTVDAQVFLPTWHGGFINDAKALRAIDVDAETLSSSVYATVGYNTDPSTTTFTDMPSPFNSGSQRQRVEFPNGTSCNLLDLRVTLSNTDNTVTPKIFGVALHNQLRTLLYQVIELTVLADDGLQKRDGTPLRWGAQAIRDFLVGLANTPGSVTLTLPDEQTWVVTCNSYQDVRAWDWRTRRWRSAIKVRLSQVSVSSYYGLYSRLEGNQTYGSLESQIYSGLEAF